MIEGVGDLEFRNPKRGIAAPARRDPKTGWLLLEVTIADARMHVPSIVRDFGAPLMLVPRGSGHIDILTEGGHRSLVRRLSLAAPTPAVARERALALSEFQAMFWDDEGFMNLTIGLLAWARISGVGLLVVQNHRAQLWEPDRYRAGGHAQP